MRRLYTLAFKDVTTGQYGYIRFCKGSKEPYKVIDAETEISAHKTITAAHEALADVYWKHYDNGHKMIRPFARPLAELTESKTGRLEWQYTRA